MASAGAALCTMRFNKADVLIASLGCIMTVRSLFCCVTVVIFGLSSPIHAQGGLGTGRPQSIANGERRTSMNAVDGPNWSLTNENDTRSVVDNNEIRGNVDGEETDSSKVAIVTLPEASSSFLADIKRALAHLFEPLIGVQPPRSATPQSVKAHFDSLPLDEKQRALSRCEEIIEKSIRVSQAVADICAVIAAR